MTNFIKDNTGLFATKSDLIPIGAGDPTKYLQASEVNLLKQALLDIQALLRNALWYGGNTSSPAAFALGATQNDYTPANWATISTWRLQAADNEGTRITGFGALNDGDIREVTNVAPQADDGVLVLQHQNGGSIAANRIFCPGDQDLLIQKGCSALLRYDGIKAGWVVITQGGRFRYVTAEWLGLYPNALFPAITGTVNNYNPTATNLQGAAFTGLGAAGGSLAFKDNSVCELQTVDGTGAILTGLEWANAGLGSNAEPSNHGPLKVLVNLGPGPITLKHSNTGSTVGNRLFCPSQVDLKLNVGDVALVLNLESLGWYVIANSSRVDGIYSSLTSATRNISNPLTPGALGLGNNNDWNPTNFAGSQWVRAQGNAGGSTITGMLAGNVGDVKTICNLGGGAITFSNQDGNSAAANRIILHNSSNVTIPATGGSITFIYDSIGRWWEISRSS